MPPSHKHALQLYEVIAWVRAATLNSSGGAESRLPDCCYNSRIVVTIGVTKLRDGCANKCFQVAFAACYLSK